MPTTSATRSVDGEESRRRRRAMWLSLVVGIVLLGAKWLAYFLTGSSAILSDALESIINVVASAVALASLVLNDRPPDGKYPYGYGKVGYFSAGFEGALITLAALAILVESVKGLLWPPPLGSLGWGLALVALAGGVNLALGGLLIRRGRRTASLILEADGHHLVSDAVTSVGVLGGVTVVAFTGWQRLDPLVAMAVGLSIVRTGYRLVREAFVGLMDRADPELLGRIVRVLGAARGDGWLDLHQLRAWRAGDWVYVDCHLVVPGDWTVTQLHETNERCRAAVRSELGATTEVIIHFDPDRIERSWRIPEGPWTVASAVRVPGADANDPGSGGERVN
jgi:cation diffusion facilitator family transporter